MIIFQKFNNYRKFKNVVFLLTTLLMTAWQSQAQQLISVPFDRGFVGTVGSNTQQANSIQSFSVLGINRVFFQQISNTNIFQAQGNDIPGKLLIEMQSGQTFTIDGAVVWRISSGNVVELFGFLANSGTSINLNTYGGSNYTITGGTSAGNSTFGLIKLSSSYTFSNGSNVSGNAAGVLGDLNAYLSETTNPANLPAGPVTVNNMLTQSIQPTITGTVFLNQGNNETFSVSLDGVLYTTTNGLVIDGNNNTWSLTIPAGNALTIGQSYTVTATITSGAGYTLQTTGSVQVEVPLCTLGSITIVSSGGAAEGTTWTYSNNTILPNSATNVSLNVSEVVNYLGSGDLKIKAKNITVATSVVSTSNKNLTLQSCEAIVFNSASGITTQGGSVILWADYDGGDSGDVFFGTTVSILTGGGHLWIGGGSGLTTWNGLTVGDGYAVGDVPRAVSSFTHHNGITIQGTNIQTSGGHIKMLGKGKAGVFTGSSYSGGMYLLNSGSMNSGGGDIDIETLSNTGSGQKYGLYNLGAYTFAPGEGNLTIFGDASASSAGITNVTGNGVFLWTSVAPISSSGNIVISGKKSSASGTFGVDIRTQITTTGGSITLDGDVLNLLANISASDAVNLKATSATTYASTLTTNTLNLTGIGSSYNFTGTNNGVANLTANTGNITYTDKDALALGQITSTGLVNIATATGDMILGGNVSTTSTSANAIILNAGKNAAIGTITGGDIKISGTPSITTGAGGIAKLFSGSSSASTGLVSLVGSSNIRYEVDETTTTFDPVLVGGNAYALYRESIPVVEPDITSFSPIIAGNGETVVITGTGFTGVTTVNFGNQAATSFVVDSDTQITAIVGNGTSGALTVTNSAGSDFENGFIFKVVEYLFEGNTLDNTDANLDGNLVGTATYEPGATGQSICFDNTYTTGANVANYLTLPSNLIRGQGTDFTISLRFKTDTRGALLGYQNKDVGTPLSPGQWIPLLYVGPDGRITATILLGGSILSATSTSIVNDNNWHKVDFSIAPGAISIYVDNVLEGSSNGTINHLSMTFNQLGAAGVTNYFERTGDWEGFKGCIDDFIIIDRALTAAEIVEVTALPEPTIVSFSPTSASAGVTLNITGTNFSGATSVTIGGVAAQSFVVVSDTTITAVVANGASSGDISVTTAGGTAVATGFTYINALPTISSISNQILCTNETPNPINFLIADLETPVANLALTVTSSNIDLLPVSNISFAGTSAERTINYTTVAGEFGTTTVTITVDDLNGGTASETFTVLVEADKVQTSSGISNLQVGTPVIIDPQLVINETGNINGALVLISSGFVTGDVLAYTGSLPSGVTRSYNTSSGVLTFTGNMSPAELQDIFRAVTINTTSTNEQDRTVTFTLGVALPFSENNHFYQFITSPGINWTNAKIAAEQLNFFGLQGYLTTVTSQSENNFILSKIQGQGWMGASDAEVEGVWRWVTGPEAGQQFWQGTSGGSVVNGLYNNWSTGEPNNQGNEDYAHFLFDGKWNDFPLTVASIQGYVVEFGGMPNDPCVVLSADKIVEVILNIPPTISNIANQSICYNGSTEVLNFVIGDENTPLDDLVMTATSSNITLVPNDQIVIAGSGANRTVQVLPVMGQSGSTTISLTVTDQFGAATTMQFNVLVDDTEPPIVITQNITVQLDANGEATIGVSDIDNGSSDNCGIASLSLDITSFSCDDISTGPATFDGETVLRFDGVDDNVIHSSVIPQTTNHTIAAWIQSSTINRNVFGWGGSGINNYSSLSFIGGSVRYYAGNGTAPVESVTGTVNVIDGNWHHVAVSRASTGEVRIYIDGNLDVTGSVTKYVSSPTNSSIGSIFANGSYQGLFNGQIDELSVWSSVLTEQQIKDLSCGNVNTSDVNLLAYYDFNGVSGDLVLTDLTGNHDGNLVNFDQSTAWTSFGTPVENTNCSSGVLVTLTATDASGNSSTGTAIVTVEDNEAPQITCVTNQTVDTNIGVCTYTHIGTAWDATATDNCSIATTVYVLTGVTTGTGSTLDGVAFNLGETTVTWTATDSSGNTDECSFTVTVEDNEAPTAFCVAPFTIQLDANGEASITPTDIDGGSTDNCGIASIEIDRTDFDCNDLGDGSGENYVYALYPWSATDNIYRYDFDPATLALSFDSVVGSTGHNVNFGFDVNPLTGEYYLIATAGSQRGLYTLDINTFATTLITPLTSTTGNTNAQDFAINNAGEFVILYQDGSVNKLDINTGISTFFATVTTAGGAIGFTYDYDNDRFLITNSYNPVTLSELTAAGVQNTLFTFLTPGISGDCTAQGIEYVGNGKCIASSTFGCNLLYSIDLNAETVALIAQPNGSPEASIKDLLFSPTSSNIHTVTLTITDVNGNVSTCTTQVTVEDNIAPLITCLANQIIDTDAGECSYTHSGSAWDATATDNCSIATTVYVLTGVTTGTGTTLDGVAFNLGVTTVTWTATDGSGNTDECSFTVTVEDNEPPVITCVTNQTVDTNVGVCTYTHIGTAWDATATDNCSIATTVYVLTGVTTGTGTTLNGVAFNLGVTTVTWTTTDGSGNPAVCSFTVTVEDNEAPQITCVANQTVDTDFNLCTYTHNGSAWDATATDNCSIATTVYVLTGATTGTGTTLDGVTFNLGVTTVTWTTTDGSGNTNDCSFTVTVEDNQAPQIVCPLDIIINAEPGMCGAQVFFGNATALDACSGFLPTVQTAGPVSGSFFPVGDTVISFSATDAAGNVATCSFTITVEDNQAPLAVCQNITIQLDANGVATITAEELNGGSTDNCGSALTYTASQTSFDCSHVGENTITLTVTDAAGNSSTCTAIVTVEDTIAPVAQCAAPFTIQLDANGTASITVADIDNGSTDNCSGATITLSQSTFTCADLGENTITLTITDASGNTATCTTVVTVEDTIAPIVSCIDFTLELGPDGTALLTPEDIGGTSTDNCAITITAIDIEAFDCSDIGTPVLVTYFASDSSGNIASCTALVTVVDNLGPVIDCPEDMTVDTDPNSITYTLPDYFGEGLATATDNCTDPVTIVSQTPAAGTLLLDGTYTITLTAEDAYGNESVCSFELTVDTILGNEDRLDFSSLTMYPNPAERTVTIGNPQSIAIDKVSIYDVQGRLVFSKNTNGDTGNQTINVSDLSSAVYMVVIESDGNQTVKRLIRK